MKASKFSLLADFLLMGATNAYPIHLPDSQHVSGVAASVVVPDGSVSNSTLAVPSAADSNVVNGGGKVDSVKPEQLHGDSFGGVITVKNSGEASQVKAAPEALESIDPTVPPSSTSSPSVHEQAKAYGESIALWLLHHILLIIIASATVAACWLLASKWHEVRDATALLSGVAITSLVYVVLSNTVYTFGIIQFGILFGDLIFHTRYCQLRAIGTGNTWGFVLGTTLITVLLFTLVHMSVLSDLWRQNTGLPGVLLVLPIHIVVFELGAYERRGGQ